MKKRMGVVLAIVVGVGALGIGYYSGTNVNKPESEIVSEDSAGLELPHEAEKQTVTLDEVESKLKEMEELTTYSGEYHCEKEVDQARYLDEEKDIKYPLTTNTIHMECDGIVKVGYDLTEIGIDIDTDKETIYVELPQARVLDNYIIMDSVECEEENNILNPIQFSQYQKLMTDIEENGLNDVEENGIYDKAESNMKSVLENFLDELGYAVEFV